MSEEKYKKYKRDLYAWRRDHGICTICGKAAAIQNKRLCAACAQHEKERFERKYKTDGEYREKMRKNNLTRYNRCVSEGLCVQCGRRNAIKGHRRCEECKAMIAIVITVILSAIAGIAWALCASSTDGECGEEDKENEK